MKRMPDCPSLPVGESRGKERGVKMSISQRERKERRRRRRILEGKKTTGQDFSFISEVLKTAPNWTLGHLVNAVPYNKFYALCTS